MSKSFIPAKRRAWIQEYLSVHKIVRSIELSEQLGISEATVRRDLEWLETEGIIVRTHGGAMLTKRMHIEPKYVHRAQLYAEEKRKIGLTAAALVEDGDIIFVNSGTTTTQVIRHLRRDADITVVTNNLSASLEISEPSFELLLVGGEFQPRSNSVAGRFATDNIGQIYANKAFIGVDGLTLEQGCTVPSNAEAEVDRMMIERTRGPIIIVTYHSKWGLVSNFEIAKIEQIDKLVTDLDFDGAGQAALATLGVDIIMVNAAQA